MQPPSTSTRTNLFGTTNTFSAANLNNSATLDSAAESYSRSHRGYDLKKSRKRVKDSSYYGYGYKKYFKKGEENIQSPGSRFSSGLWLAEQTKWFRDDQPFEVNQPRNPGDGGPAEYSKWNQKKGKGIGGKLSWINPKPGDNEALGAFMKARLAMSAMRSNSPIYANAYNNFKEWAKSAQFGGAGRGTYGYKADIFSSRSNRIQINKDLLTNEGWAQKGFGWAADMSQEMFTSALKPQVNDKARESYALDTDKLNAAGADSPWVKYDNKTIYSDDLGNYHEMNVWTNGSG